MAELGSTTHTTTTSSTTTEEQEEAIQFLEIFTQDGVNMVSGPKAYSAYFNLFGTVYITQYTVHNGGAEERKICLEWRPIEVIAEYESEVMKLSTAQPNSLSDDSSSSEGGQDQEWAVVKTVQERHRTHSESQPPPTTTTTTTATASETTPTNEAPRLPCKYLKIALEPSMSFRVTYKSHQLTVYDGKTEQIASFLFQHGDCGHFVVQLRRLLRTVAMKRDRNWFMIGGNSDRGGLGTSTSPEEQRLQRSFAELKILQDHQPSWARTIRNLREFPVQMTLETFAKFTNYVYDNSGEFHLNNNAKDLLTNSFAEYCSQGHDYEVINKVPKLPERRQCQRGESLTLAQWREFQNANGQLHDVNTVKSIIFRGTIEPEIRAEVWKFLLNVYPWQSTFEDRTALDAVKSADYHRMKQQWCARSSIQDEHFSEYRERKHLVDKDVLRTDRTWPFYSGDNNANLKQLYDILMTYVMYNFDLGYVQGMSDLLSPILHLFQDEVTAFWCFAGFMDKVSCNFDVDQAGMKDQLKNVYVLLSFVEPELANYLDAHDSSNMFFCFRWLLVWFKRELDEEYVLRLWEVLWTGIPCKNFHLLICVAILEQEKSIIISNGYGFTEILKHINELCGHLDVDQLLCRAEAIFYQIQESKYLTDNIRLVLGLPVPGLDSEDSTPNEDVSTLTAIDTNADGDFYERFYNNAQHLDT